MTKKDFEALARAMRLARPALDTPEQVINIEYKYMRAMQQWERDVNAIAQVCEDTNDRFDREQFKAACLRAK